eukprot:10689529-Alexandrium_andersonii.AAC.1
MGGVCRSACRQSWQALPWRVCGARSALEGGCRTPDGRGVGVLATAIFGRGHPGGHKGSGTAFAKQHVTDWRRAMRSIDGSRRPALDGGWVMSPGSPCLRMWPARRRASSPPAWAQGGGTTPATVSLQFVGLAACARYLVHGFLLGVSSPWAGARDEGVGGCS